MIREHWSKEENAIPEFTSVTVEKDASDETGKTYTFNAEATDSDGQIADYQWFFGDLSFATGAEQTHTYKEPGTYYAVIYTTDNIGNTQWQQVEINIE